MLKIHNSLTEDIHNIGKEKKFKGLRDGMYFCG